MLCFYICKCYNNYNNIIKNFKIKNKKMRSIFVKYICAYAVFASLFFVFPGSVVADIAPQIYFETDPIIEGNNFSPNGTINGTVELYNYEESAIGDLFFEYQLWSKRVENVPAGLVAQLRDNKSFSLGPKEKSIKNLSYVLPSSLPPGNLVLRIQLVTGRGEDLSWADKDIVISRGSEFLAVNNQWIVKDGKNLDPGGGVYYQPGEIVDVVFDVANNSNAAVTAYYKVTNYIRNSGIAPAAEEKREAISIPAKSKKTVKTVLPKLTVPETYLSEIKFYDRSTDLPVSNSIFFRWIISGENAKVLFMSSDKKNYNAGDEARVTVSYTGSANAGLDLGKGQIETKIVDAKGNVVGEKTTEIDLKSGQIDTLVPVSKDVADPLIVANIVKDGKKLDSYKYDFNAAATGSVPGSDVSGSGKSKKIGLLGIFGFLAIAVLMLVVYYYFSNKKSKKNGGNIAAAAVVIFAGFASLAFASRAAAVTEVVNGCGDTLLTASKPNPDKKWYPGDEIIFSGKFQVKSCHNGLFNNKITVYIAENKDIPFIDCGGRTDDSCTSDVQCFCSNCVGCYGAPSAPFLSGIGVANCKSGILWANDEQGNPYSYTSFMNGDEVKDLDLSKGYKVYKLGEITPGDASYFEGERWKVEYNKSFVIPQNLDIWGPMRFYIVYSGTHWAAHWHWNISYQPGYLLPLPVLSNLKVVPPDYCNSVPGGVFSWSFSSPGNAASQSSYQIQISNNPGFNSLVYDSSQVSSASESWATSPGMLDYGKTYYWRVRVVDSYGTESQWVSGPSFTTPGQKAPEPNFSYLPKQIFAGEKIEFSHGSESEFPAYCYSGNNKILCLDDPQAVYFWDFGNGETSSEKENISVIYDQKKSYTVKLRITSNATVPPLTCSISKTIDVTERLPKWYTDKPF